MKRFTFPLFVAVTLAIIAAAWFITEQRRPETGVSKEPLYPELANQLNNVASLQIRSREQNTVIRKADSKWVISNKDDYPAVFDMVRRAVIDLSELKILEAKTRKKERYARIGVEDIDEPDSGSTLVELRDASNQVLARLIVGNPRKGSNAAISGLEALYVRRAGEEQALLVEGKLALSSNPIEWMNTNLFSISADRIQEITMNDPGESVIQLVRKKPGQPDFKLLNLPQGRKVKSQVLLNSLASGLEDLRFDDVRGQSTLVVPEDARVSRYRTSDGLVIEITIVAEGRQNYSAFTFSQDPSPVNSSEQGQGSESAGESARTLGTNTKNWLYILPGFKQEILSKSMESLTVADIPVTEQSTAEDEEEKTGTEQGQID